MAAFRAHTPQKWHWFLHLWSILILVSVLTTWQHHFIDVITGAATGVVISYLLPVSTRWQWAPHRIRRGYQLAGRYAVISLVLITAAVVMGGQGWWLLWPGLAFLCITAGYLGAGASVFQKDSAGAFHPLRHSCCCHTGLRHKSAITGMQSGAVTPVWSMSISRWVVILLHH